MGASTFSPLASLALALAYLRCHLLFPLLLQQALLPEVFVGQKHLHVARASITSTHPHPQREVHEHTSSTLGGACRCAVRKKLPGRDPLALQNPVLMPVQSM